MVENKMTIIESVEHSVLRIGILDYGLGNIASIADSIEVLGSKALVIREKQALREIDAIILPGVGAFGSAMKALHLLGLMNDLEKVILHERLPCLGICLGMQLFAKESEEHGKHCGLGWIAGTVQKLTPKGNLRIPHVGWNQVVPSHENPLFERVSGSAAFYFDHSYHFNAEDKSIIARTNYGGDFICGVQKDNLFGVQFHPEKSQRAGLRLFRGFLNVVKREKGLK